MAPKDEFPKKPDRVSVSRRNFLKTAGVSSLATAVTSVGVAEVEAQTGPAVDRPGRRAGDADGQRQAGRPDDRAARHAARTRCATAPT